MLNPIIEMLVTNQKEMKVAAPLLHQLATINCEDFNLKESKCSIYLGMSLERLSV